jgi:septal ring factor EnvC (AmiA/AmiB activator)
MSVESTDVSIKSLRENLMTLLSQASDTELDGRRVVDERSKTIRALHAEKLKQQSLQATRRADLAALNAEFARMLNRYRELRGTTAAPATAAAPPPPAPAGG